MRAQELSSANCISCPQLFQARFKRRGYLRIQGPSCSSAGQAPFLGLSDTLRVFVRARFYFKGVRSMTHAQMERELSRTTGESLSTIRRRGFQLIEPPAVSPLTVDWDAL